MFVSTGCPEAFGPHSGLQIPQKDARYVCVRPRQVHNTGRRKVILLLLQTQRQGVSYLCCVVIISILALDPLSDVALEAPQKTAKMKNDFKNVQMRKARENLLE